MKKAIKIITMTTVLMLMLGAVNAFAADDIGVYVDGEKIEFDVAPQIISDRTMIPFRYVANAFDAEVDYKEEADGTKVVTAVQGDKTLKLTIGNTDAVLIENGKEEVLTFDVAPVIVDSRTLVPVRLVGEAFGCSVGWDNENRNVMIIDIESSINKYKSMCPELFDEVLSVDLTKINGYYNIYYTSLMNEFENTLTMSLAADDDAAMVSISYGNDQFDIIATGDALYMSSAYTMGLWVKYPYTDIAPDFKFNPNDLVADSNAMLKQLTDSLLMNEELVASSFELYDEVLKAIVDSALAGNMEIVTEGDRKSVTYEIEFSENGGTSYYGINKVLDKDVLAFAEITSVYITPDSATSGEIMGTVITIEREDAAEDFDIVAPPADTVIEQ